MQFSLSVPGGVCEGTEEDICVVLETVIEREAAAEMIITDACKGY